MCLKYGRASSGLTGFCDSNYGGDLDARKSTSGFVFIMGGSAVNWQSSIQDVTIISTTEVEYNSHCRIIQKRKMA